MWVPEIRKSEALERKGVAPPQYLLTDINPYYTIILVIKKIAQVGIFKVSDWIRAKMGIARVWQVNYAEFWKQPWPSKKRIFCLFAISKDISTLLILSFSCFHRNIGSKKKIFIKATKKDYLHIEVKGVLLSIFMHILLVIMQLSLPRYPIRLLIEKVVWQMWQDEEALLRYRQRKRHQ